MRTEPDYYEILQVHPDAEWEVIEVAYRRLARKYHPDVNKGTGAEDRMRELNAAYEVLSNPILREDYDRRRSYGGFVAGEPISDSGSDGTVSGGEPRSVAAACRFWLRWLAVLPASILSAVLVSFPVHWAVMIFTGLSGNDDSIGLWDLPPETLERLGQAFFAPLSFVAMGARTAPAYRLHTAVMLVILWAMALGAGMMYASTLGGYRGWGWAEFGGVIVLGIGGMVGGIYWIYEREREAQVTLSGRPAS